MMAHIQVFQGNNWTEPTSWQNPIAPKTDPDTCTNTKETLVKEIDWSVTTSTHTISLSLSLLLSVSLSLSVSLYLSLSLCLSVSLCLTLRHTNHNRGAVQWSALIVIGPPNKPNMLWHRWHDCVVSVWHHFTVPTNGIFVHYLFTGVFHRGTNRQSLVRRQTMLIESVRMNLSIILAPVVVGNGNGSILRSLKLN